MNPITFGMGGPFYITLGFKSGEAAEQLGSVCVTDASGTVTIEDSVPCP